MASHIYIYYIYIIYIYILVEFEPGTSCFLYHRNELETIRFPQLFSTIDSLETGQVSCRTATGARDTKVTNPILSTGHALQNWQSHPVDGISARAV